MHLFGLFDNKNFLNRVLLFDNKKPPFFRRVLLGGNFLKKPFLK